MNSCPAHQISMPIPVLETERLVLRALAAEDFPAFAVLHASPHAALMWAITDSDLAWDRFLALAGGWMVKGAGMWALADRGTDAFVGHVGYIWAEGAAVPELGWALVASAQGRGLATEGVRAARHWGWSHGIARPVSHIDARNLRSIRLAERLGAIEESRTVYGDDAVALHFRHPEAQGVSA